MRSLSTDSIDNILLLLHRGFSVRRVADRCHVSKSVVQKLRVKHLPDLSLPKPGRPAKLSAQNKRFCVRAITSGKMETGVAVGKKLKDEIGVKVCDSTVSNALREAGLGAVEKEANPKLSHKTPRLGLSLPNATNTGQ